MMTIAFGCVVIALFFPYLFTILAKRAKPGYNNHYPRDYLASLDGWPKRAHCVQMNSFEAFPAFAAGVIIAHLQGAPQHTVDMLAMAFIVLFDRPIPAQENNCFATYSPCGEENTYSGVCKK